MQDRGQELLHLLFKLSEVDPTEFAKALNESLKEGYITKAEFERFVIHMNDRVDTMDKTMALMVENVSLKLKQERQEHFKAFVEYELPDAVAKVNAERRRGFIAWAKNNIGLIVQILLFAASVITFIASLKNVTDARDMKRIDRAAEIITDNFN